MHTFFQKAELQGYFIGFGGFENTIEWKTQIIQTRQM